MSLQQNKKRFINKCFFCEEKDYDLLDSHRILEGNKGGKYHWANVLVLCALCHRKVHSGKIKILGSYPSSSARQYIHYIDENGKDHWKPE